MNDAILQIPEGKNHSLRELNLDTLQEVRRLAPFLVTTINRRSATLSQSVGSLRPSDIGPHPKSNKRQSPVRCSATNPHSSQPSSSLAILLDDGRETFWSLRGVIHDAPKIFPYPRPDEGVARREGITAQSAHTVTHRVRRCGWRFFSLSRMKRLLHYSCRCQALDISHTGTLTSLSGLVYPVCR